MVTTIIGGLGSDTIDVGGDVTGTIVALSVEGVSGFINHTLTSADPAYDGIFADGIHLNVAGSSTGTVVVTPSSGSSRAVEDGTAGANVDTYTVRLAVAAPAIATTAYLTVAAILGPSADRAAGGKLIEVSTDNVHYAAALVLTFDSGAASGTATDWTRTQTIYVRAAGDTAVEGERTAVVSHSIQSANPAFDRLNIANVEVKVIDDDKAGLIVTQTGNGTQVVEGGATDTYTIALTRSPASGETVTVAIGGDSAQVRVNGVAPSTSAASVSFTSANWNTAQTITVSAVDDSLVENRLLTTLTHAITSTGGVFTAAVDDHEVDVDVRDNDAGGLLVTESDGYTLVAPGAPDTYTLRLTKAPMANVTVAILTDGKTLVSSSDSRFSAGAGTTPPQVVFDSTNWSSQVTITVSVNPAATTPTGQPVQSFPAQPHRTNQMFGPIIVEGGQIKDRTLRQGIRLPTETDTALPVVVIATNESQQTDTLNVFNDGSDAADDGTLGAISPTEASALNKIYPTAITPTSFGQISGLGMGGPLTLDYGTPAAHDFQTFSRGIAYHDVEVVDVLLGRKDDTFAVNATVAGSITVVQGGGGNDTIAVTGGGGPAAPLVIFGDTSQDGRFYDSTTGNQTGRARKFASSGPGSAGNDTIDARLATQSVAIYGGPGNDTIWGSQAGDHIAGGSGDDTIHGQGGDDHIYGDDGFNLDLSKRLSLSTQILLLVNAGAATDVAGTSDNLAVGADVINGDGGNDLIFGDHGRVEQSAETNRILTTGNVVSVTTVRPSEGGHDTLHGDAGNDWILGGAGMDTISGDDGNDLVLGDNATITVASGLAVVIESTDLAFGARDTIYGNAGQDVLIGGAAGDLIDGGADDDLIFGDAVRLERRATDITSPRFEALSGTVIYGRSDQSPFPTADTSGALLIDGIARAYRGSAGAPEWALYVLTDLHQTAAIEAAAGNDFGNDYLAGAAGNDVIFGQLGNDTIQGDGSIGSPRSVRPAGRSIRSGRSRSCPRSRRRPTAMTTSRAAAAPT